MPKVLIDLSPVSLKRGRGYRRYGLTLIKAVVSAESAIRFTVLAREKKIVDSIPGAISRLFVDQPRRFVPLLYSTRLKSITRILLAGVDLVHFPCGDIWYDNRGKSVVTVHDLAPLHYPSRFFENSKEEARYYRHLQMIKDYATHIVTVSEYTKEDVIKNLNIEPRRMSAVHNALDPIFIDPARTLSAYDVKRIGIDKPYLLFVGALDFRKNIPLLLKSYALYRRRGGGLNLVVVGNFDPGNSKYYPPFKPTLDSLECKRHVFVLHDVGDDILPAIYRRATALVFVSMFEGFGYPLIEAMISGTPIIAANRTSLPEVAGEAGILVDLSEESIAAAMARIEDDENLRAELKRAGVKRSQHFSLDRFAKDMIAVYHSLV